jgi:hypothetical protein
MMFIPDTGTDLDFYPSRIPDPGVKKTPDPGSGSATLESQKPAIQMGHIVQYCTGTACYYSLL